MKKVLKKANIGIVLVTYNRLKDLKVALEKYENQELLPKYIIVVNNNSNDGTTDYLKEWAENEKKLSKIVLNLEKNVGGSGGFHAGLEKSLSLDADWIWLADDDAFPELDAIKIADETINNKKLVNKKTAAICGAVINNDVYDYSHRRIIKKGLFTIKEILSKEEDYAKKSFKINLFSYVGSILNKKYLLSVGLCNKDYFIYYDDTEHSMSLNESGEILCIPAIRIHHNALLVTNKKEVGWKTYYLVRNKLFSYRKHFPKRYFTFYYYFYMTAVKVRNLLNYEKKYNKVVYDGLIDAKEGKLGLHEKYIPGWKDSRK